MAGTKRLKPKEGELKEFWKYKINPITGFFITGADKVSTNHRQDLARKRILEEKLNQEEQWS